MIELAEGTEEKVLAELHDASNEVAAQWKVVQSEIGPLAVYAELSPQVDLLLDYTMMSDVPNSQIFHSYRVAAVRARDFSRHRKYGKYVESLGFSFSESPGNGLVRMATLPTAEALTNAMDAMPRMAGRFRFYAPTTRNGRSSGLEYIQKLAEGLVPLGSPTGEPLRDSFFHDATDHAIGYTFLDACTVAQIQARAEELLEDGVELMDRGDLQAERNNLKAGTNAEGFARIVDLLTNVLNRPLIFDYEKTVIRHLPVLAELTGAIAIKQEAEKPGGSLIAGVPAALRLVRSMRREYR